MVCHMASSNPYIRECNLKCVMSDWYRVAHDEFLDHESIEVLSASKNEYTESLKQEAKEGQAEK